MGADKELNQLTAERLVAEMEELDLADHSLAAPMPKLTNKERRAKLEQILQINHPEMTEAQHKEAVELLLKNNDCFSLDLGEIGQTKGIEVEIDMGDVKLIRQSLRHVAYTIRDEVKKEIEKLLRLQVVKESDSPWSSPIVMVRRKTGDL